MGDTARTAASATGRTWVESGWARSIVTVWAAVPVSRAFDYVADMTRHPEWANDPLTVVPADTGPVGIGSRFRAVGHQAGKEWPSDLTVTGYDPPSRFEFTATGGPIGTTEDRLHRHEFLLAAADGGTRIEIHRSDPLPDWRFRLVGRPLVRASLGMRRRTAARLAQRLTELAAPDTGGTPGP